MIEISPRRRALAAAMALTLVLAACGKSAGDGAWPVGGAQAPVSGGTLVYLDPQAHNALYPPAGGFYPNGGLLNQLTDRLTYQNPKTLEIEPWIAQSWTVNADATQYTFTLRDGVTFSDGAPLDAEAVARNYDTFGRGNKALKHSVSEVINNYERSEVLDARTVRFHFSQPSPGFLQATSTINSGLVSPATLALSLDALGDATKLIGSGPFVVTSETLGKEVNLSARRDYAWGPAQHAHQGRAMLDGIQVVVAPEDSVRIGALLAGQAGVIRHLQAYDEKRVEDAQFAVYAASTRGVNGSLAFRPDNPLVADVRVRRALLHGTDAKEIVQTLFSAHYPQATGVIVAGAAGSVDLSAQLKFDPEHSARLLDEAGWKRGTSGLREKDGQPLVLSTYESLNYAQNREVMQLVAQQWARLGVKLNVLAGDLGSRAIDSLDPLKTPVLPAMVGRADPDVIKSNYHPGNRNLLLQKGGVSQKVQRFEDPALNRLLDAIARETNRDQRLALTREVQAYLVEQAYVVPLFEEPQVFAAAPWVKGVSFEAVGRPSFYAAWIDKH